MSDSPLAEASPRSLEELFNADPRQLNSAERLQMVLELRKMREAYIAAEMAGKRAPRAAKAPTKPKLSADELKALDFDSL